MLLKIVVHDAEEGGYWAEVPAFPNCATQGETLGLFKYLVKMAGLSQEGL